MDPPHWFITSHRILKPDDFCTALHDLSETDYSIKVGMMKRLSLNGSHGSCRPHAQAADMRTRFLQRHFFSAAAQLPKPHKRAAALLRCRAKKSSEYFIQMWATQMYFSIWKCDWINPENLTKPRCPAVKKRLSNTIWIMEMTVVHNRRMLRRTCWVCCGIVPPVAVFSGLNLVAGRQLKKWRIYRSLVSFAVHPSRECWLPELTACIWWGCVNDCRCFCCATYRLKGQSKWYFPMYVQKGSEQVQIVLWGLALLSDSPQLPKKQTKETKKRGKRLDQGVKNEVKKDHHSTITTEHVDESYFLIYHKTPETQKHLPCCFLFCFSPLIVSTEKIINDVLTFFWIWRKNRKFIATCLSSFCTKILDQYVNRWFW